MSAYLVIGSGEAGLQAALTLRELGSADDRVVLVGEEPWLPYQRPPLSKGFLAGETSVEELVLRERGHLAESGIELRLGVRVEKLDLGAQPSADRVRALLADGGVLDVDGVVLATGARPRTLSLPGAEVGPAGGVHLLRGIDDATALKSALAGARDVVVIGGGFVGLEVAATARKNGSAVTVLEAAAQILARVVSEPISAHIRAYHESLGTVVRTGSQVLGLRLDNGRVRGVEAAGAEVIPADVVLVGVGSEPRQELAAELDLADARGVATDAFGATVHPRVVAAGDCALQPHPHRDGERMRIESVNNAVEQGQRAAYALLGRTPKERGVPWFWSNQGDLKLQIAGISDGHDRTVVRRAGGTPGTGRLSVLYYRGDRLIAGDMIDNPRDFMAVRRALDAGRTIAPEAAADPEVALKGLVQ